MGHLLLPQAPLLAAHARLGTPAQARQLHNVFLGTTIPERIWLAKFALQDTLVQVLLLLQLPVLWDLTRYRGGSTVLHALQGIPVQLQRTSQWHAPKDLAVWVEQLAAQPVPLEATVQPRIQQAVLLAHLDIPVQQEQPSL